MEHAFRNYHKIAYSVKHTPHNFITCKNKKLFHERKQTAYSMGRRTGPDFPPSFSPKFSQPACRIFQLFSASLNPAISRCAYGMSQKSPVFSEIEILEIESRNKQNLRIKITKIYSRIRFEWIFKILSFHKYS